MDVESQSTNTSADDKTEDFCENPTRDALAEGLMCLLKPTIDTLDERVAACRLSQQELKKQIDGLQEELAKISAEQSSPINLDVYVTKLANARQKILIVSNILQSAQTAFIFAGEIEESSSSGRKGASANPISDVLALHILRQNMSSCVPKLATPDWSSNLSENVYEPSEDSFLLLDALEADLQLIKEKIQPLVLLEVGSGSGVVITALSKLLASHSFCMAVDINWDACVATRETATLNDTQVDVIQMDLDSGLCLNNQVDLLVFNPPYVVTPDEEIESGGIVASWAGGKNGRQVLDRLLENLTHLLSKKSIGYFVVVEENQPEAIKSKLLSSGLTAKTVARRKVRNEALSILRFQPQS